MEKLMHLKTHGHKNEYTLPFMNYCSTSTVNIFSLDSFRKKTKQNYSLPYY